MARRVAVIGGGSSGLCAIKACLDEGLEPVCFERSRDIGGLWRFEEQPEEGRASIYRSVIINTSKEMMCFSDFPIPDDFPNYMHHSKIMEYFRMYARRFDLLRHVRFGVRDGDLGGGTQGSGGCKTLIPAPPCPDQRVPRTSAIFEDGTREDIDAVVFATGYSFSFPFLEECVKVVENQASLYKFMFPVDLEKPTLAFIGFIQPLGAIMPISELQCRWATRVFKGLQELPPTSTMLADIAQTKEKMAKRYVASRRHTIQVDYIPYMDELACQLGVKPNLPLLFLTDPPLALEVLLGPCTPYQYRLRGPGAWRGARAAILTQRQRVLQPLCGAAGRSGPRSSSVPHLLKVCFSIGLIAATLVYISLSP
ncbi:FMO5 monooxygenase, partial [Asarcornis scutulata]|nr:FMO5 monooxygenase [Asarcornis scutulata]